MKKMDFDADLKCPECSKRIKKKVKLSPTSKTIKCPHCGVIISFDDKEFKKAEKALDRLMDTLPESIDIKL